MKRFSFTEIKVTDDTVYVVDDNKPGYVTITNMAEEVVRLLHANHGDKRFVYRDTDNVWGELLHEGAVFKGFAEHNGLGN